LEGLTVCWKTQDVFFLIFVPTLGDDLPVLRRLCLRIHIKKGFTTLPEKNLYLYPKQTQTEAPKPTYNPIYPPGNPGQQ